MTEAARKLIHHLSESVRLLVELLPGEAATTTFTATVQPPAVVAVARPKLSAASADDEDEDEDDEPPARRQPTEKRPNKVVSIGEVADKIGGYIRKIGVGQKFTSHDVNALFDGEVSNATVAEALKRWITQGFVERTEKGVGRKPGQFRKARAMEHED